MDVPRGMPELIADLFHAAGLTGKHILFLGPHIKGTAHIQGISVRGLYDGKVVNLRVQPGDNTTSYLVRFTVPDGVNPQEMLRRLQRAEAQLDSSQKLPRYEKKMRQLFRMLDGRDFMLADLSEDIYRKIGFATALDLVNALRGLAKNAIFLSTDSGGRFSWTPNMRKRMADLGFEAGLETETETEPTEEESEEDGILRRILEADGELEVLKSDIVKATAAVEAATKESDALGADVSALMEKLEALHEKQDAARRREADLIKVRDDLVFTRSELEHERNQLDARLGAIDLERRVAQDKRKAEALLAGLTPEQKLIMRQLLEANGSSQPNA